MLMGVAANRHQRVERCRRPCPRGCRRPCRRAVLPGPYEGAPWSIRARRTTPPDALPGPPGRFPVRTGGTASRGRSMRRFVVVYWSGSDWRWRTLTAEGRILKSSEEGFGERDGALESAYSENPPPLDRRPPKPHRPSLGRERSSRSRQTYGREERSLARNFSRPSTFNYLGRIPLPAPLHSRGGQQHCV